MKLVLVHGFNVKDKGRNTTDRLAPYARANDLKIDIDEGDYGYFNLFMIRWFKAYLKSRVIYRLAKAFEDADIIITHSNGANFAIQALDLLPAVYNNTKIVIHISPALNSGTPIPCAVKAQLVLYTPHDGWVKLASYLPLHPWGRMGARGYTGTSNKNTNQENDAVKKHSDWFKIKHVRSTWTYCYDFIKEHTK